MRKVDAQLGKDLPGIPHGGILIANKGSFSATPQVCPFGGQHCGVKCPLFELKEHDYYHDDGKGKFDPETKMFYRTEIRYTVVLLHCVNPPMEYTVNRTENKIKLEVE